MTNILKTLRGSGDPNRTFTACFLIFLIGFFLLMVLTRCQAATQHGIASHYGLESGSKTASGQRLNPSAMTAAHRTLPFGTKVKVTNLRNKREVVVTITDRGPFIRSRVIDLTNGAARAIGMGGLAPVRLTY